jgi:hypothetical protein
MLQDDRAAAVTGRCLCATVRYEVRGPLRDVIFCHCQDCRRWHGHVCAATAARRADLVLLAGEEQLRWFESPSSEAHARRGFCGRCGSSLFWDAPGRPTITIAAGTLDAPTGLRAQAHVYTDFAGDYYALCDDGLARFTGPSGRF